MGPETPNPITVRVLRGDCALNVVLRDVLGMTKINPTHASTTIACL